MATEHNTTCPVAVIAPEAETLEAEIRVADESFDSARKDASSISSGSACEIGD